MTTHDGLAPAEGAYRGGDEGRAPEIPGRGHGPADAEVGADVGADVVGADVVGAEVVGLDVGEVLGVLVGDVLVDALGDALDEGVSLGGEELGLTTGDGW